MVNDLVIATESGVFVLDGIEAVGAAGNDLLDVVVVKRCDVLHRLHLEEEFITRSLGGITGTGFLGAEDSELYADVVQYANDGDGDLFGSIVKAAAATDPEKYLRGFACGEELGHGFDFNVFHFAFLD